MQQNQQKGLLLGLTAYFIWAMFPFYFKRLDDYNAMEIVVHRAVWTFVLLLLFLIITKHWQFLKTLKENPNWLILTFLSGFLIATNWTVYVWAVNNDKILDASLGYFLSPLFGIALSFFVLKEQLRPLQWFAVGLASIAIIIQIALLGIVPMVALGLSLTFSIYGLLHKKSPLNAVSALFLETLFMLPFFMVYFFSQSFASQDLSVWQTMDGFWLMMSGIITLIPLLSYNKAAKLLNLSTLNFMQYLSPTAVFFIGVFYYKESFDVNRLLVFGLIWFGLFLYTYDLLKYRKNH